MQTAYGLSHNDNSKATEDPYSVSEISALIKRNIESSFSDLRIRGEISGAKCAPSGHLYFSIKDHNAVISAVCWRGTMNNSSYKIKDGDEVICSGSITTYSGQSKYQIIVTHIEPAGIGKLMQLLEERRQQFLKEGLFEQARKKPIPFMPKIIGIVTSPTGSVIRDMLHRITDRFPTRVLLWPSLVQGELAAEQIAKGIDGFNSLKDELKPDILIVARGGGSIEDLWPFNEEIVVRAIAASDIPIISAIGHETDFTLSDFAADLRAPTPSAAAEKATPVLSEVLSNLEKLSARNTQAFSRKASLSRDRIKATTKYLPSVSKFLGLYVQRLDILYDKYNALVSNCMHIKKHKLAQIHLNPSLFKSRIITAKRSTKYLYSMIYRPIKQKLENQSAKLNYLSTMLDSLSYKNTLARGYSIVKDGNNNILDSRRKMLLDMEYRVEFADGEVKVKRTE